MEAEKNAAEEAMPLFGELTTKPAEQAAPAVDIPAEPAKQTEPATEEPVVIEEAMAVDKSYPGFYEAIKPLGIDSKPAG